MLLAVSANNTNTVFAVWDGAQLKGAWRAGTDARRTADEYVVWLDHLLAMDGLSRREIDGAIISSVVPEANFNLRLLCRRYCRSEPLVVGDAGVSTGIKALVDRPEEVGADRIINTIAAHDRHHGPLIVVDFGTATTFDVVDRDGNYCGGVIAPGINLSIEALHKAAARLPRIGIGRPQAVIGTNTIAAMQSGIYWGYVAMIEGMVARIKAESAADLKVIATGGLAPLLAEGTTVIEHSDPDITLEGLRLLAARNPVPTLSRAGVRPVEGD
jgi:type III pantothenate kinase